ncbi:tumor protein D54-like isoform X1 [Pseudochaenichthys georgianus]|uniref:tumor protein D54-like isoform X1 n=1 Tax=Pseudochaenichthys georgianus TaxID=52239 RepID=UPI001469BC3D|nr:tumor protein D54-like isoform X1 [Pseudochaenichthys georgianus]
MDQQGYGGASSSMRYSPRVMENGISPPNLSEEDIDYLRTELTKAEDEIQTLRQVLLVKEKYAVEIRSELGLTPFSNIKQNLSKGWQEVQTSTPYLTASATLDDISNSNIVARTRESLFHAGHVTSSALSNMGVSITRRLADMRALPLPSPPRLSHTVSVPSMRHSALKSLDEVVGSVKVRSSKTKIH